MSTGRAALGARRAPTASRLAVLLSVALTQPIQAHDLWIEPLEFSADVGTQVPFAFITGHGARRQRSQMRLARILQLEAHGPEGVVDLRPNVDPGEGSLDGSISFDTPGLHELVLRSDNAAISRLPASRFNAHLSAEGQTQILASRARAEQTEADGSERYGRVAKSLIWIKGDRSPAAFNAGPLGLPLELVLQPPPTDRDTANSVHLRVFRSGLPLDGVQVRLTALDGAQPPRKAIADEHGSVRFPTVGVGKWVAAAVWMQPAARGDSVDYETWFTSLSFELWETDASKPAPSITWP